MALTATQYADMKRLYRAVFMAGDYGPSTDNSDAAILRFFFALLAEASGATPLDSATQFFTAERFRSHMRATPTEVTDFLAQLATDATGSALPASQYLGLKDRLRGALRLTSTELLGFISTIAFSGNFGAIFTAAGLTVLQYLRSDLGVTGSPGVTAWADQSGNGVNVTPAVGTTEIGTVTTGLNGHAGISADGSTQGGQYTLALPGASVGTPTFFWAIWRLLSAPNVPSRLFSDQNASLGTFVNSGTTNYFGLGNSTIGPVTAAIGSWGRSENQFSNQASDYVKFGSGAPATAASGNTVPNSLRGIFCTNLGSGKIGAELLVFVTIAGIPLPVVLADAGAKGVSFYGAAVNI